MDYEENPVVCSGGRNTDDVNIKKESCNSERTCIEIKLEPDSDDGTQNQIVPSHSLVEYRNADVTSDDGAVDMKTEVKEETWWHASFLPDKFQPELSSLSQSQTKKGEDIESLYESSASTCTNINQTVLVSASYAWHPTAARINPVNAPKYGSEDVAHAVIELRKLQESVNKHISINQFDIFGRSIASQLNNMRYHRALLAQSQIQTLLTNIAIEALHSSGS